MDRAIAATVSCVVVLTFPPILGGEIGLLYQPPILSEEGLNYSRPADSQCNQACPQAQASSAAVASPGMDIEQLRVRIDEIGVWGYYWGGEPPGSPPAEDDFTVKAYLPGGGSDLPGSEVCSAVGIVTSRETVASILGWDIYRHTLHFSTPCVLTVPGNKVYWVEVFNDTGPADDWVWLGGMADWVTWPFDCCDTYSSFGTSIDSSHAPGEAWDPYWYPLAFWLEANDVGETQGLRLSKSSDEELLLQWEGDCGAGVDYSVYRGDLDEGYSSLAPEPGLCDVSGTSVTVPVGDGADFFLVVPWVDAVNGTCILWGQEHCRAGGSYGADSGGVAREQPVDYCYYKVSSYNLDDCAP